MLPNILGYHCNEKKRCTNFIEKRELIWSSSKRDEQWLGDGMYFWDTLSNAKYWKRRKEDKKNDNNEKFGIIKAQINIENILDLTDEDILKGVEEYWKEFISTNNLIKDKKKIDTKEVYIGEKLNYLLEYVASFKVFNVIKIHGIYPNKKEKFIKYKTNKNRSPGPTTQVRVIFSIKDSSVVLNSCYIEE